MTLPLAERYLARLGVAKPERLDLAALSTILEAHLRAIPWENVTSYTGTPVSVDEEAVLSKLLEGRRGGYCMEHAILSRAALAALGFKTEAILARVYFGPITDSAMAQTHCAAVVHIDGGEYLFDTGFGRATPNIPVRLDVGSAPQAGPFGTYRVRSAAEAREAVGKNKMGDDVILVLESLLGDAWTPLYGLTPRPVVDADLTAMNWFVCTYPGGLFSSSLLCATWDGHYRTTCFDKHFKKVDEQGTAEVDVANRDDVQRWLCTEMGLSLDAKMVDVVWDRLNNAPRTATTTADDISSISATSLLWQVHFLECLLTLPDAVTDTTLETVSSTHQLAPGCPCAHLSCSRARRSRFIVITTFSLTLSYSCSLMLLCFCSKMLLRSCGSLFPSAPRCFVIVDVFLSGDSTTLPHNNLPQPMATATNIQHSLLVYSRLPVER